jgi:hypothetical protein
VEDILQEVINNNQMDGKHLQVMAEIHTLE